MQNQKKYRWFMEFILPFVMLFIMVFHINSYAASDQTTIIMLDPNRSYQIGETVKVTIGVESTDGSYLKSADCGFGYNGATMELLTETDAEDHIVISSDTPQKQLYGTLEFKMKANGKMYFIAGAYSGDEVIKAIRASGEPITLPRASVVYKIGTGQYTKTSDCNLNTITFKFGDVTYSPTRDFSPMITEYWMTVPADVDKLDISAMSENPDDTVTSDDMSLAPGDNDKHVTVTAKDGVSKEYLFHVHRPGDPVTLSNIKITANDGSDISYTFDPDTMEYNIPLTAGQSHVTLSPETTNDTKLDQTEFDVREGFTVEKVTASTISDTKVYQFNFFRTPEKLALTSLVVEGVDTKVLQLDKPFSAENTEYWASVTPDVSSVKFIYTLGNEKNQIKEKNTSYKLEQGDNKCTITVTDGANEKAYTVHILRPNYDDVNSTTTAPVDTRNHTEIKQMNIADFTQAAIVAGIIIVVIFVFVFTNILKANKEYSESDEAKAEALEKERKERLKEKKKKREEENKDKLL